jgi:hypothetical protein
MASKARVGRGSALSIGGVTDGTTVAFQHIAEANKASFSGGSWGTVDVTSFDSGVDEEFKTTTRNNGDLNLEGFLVDSDAGQVAVQAAYDSGNLYDFKLQLLPGPGQTTGTLYTFSGLVQSLDIPVETRSAITFTIKVKISGAIVRTIGT